jgi:hypothetical protein
MGKPTEKALSNLKPWKPGQSGNISGRPKRLPISDALRRLADRKFNEKTKKRRIKNATFADIAAHEQFLRAINGDTRALTEIREAIEGKATQRIELAPDLETVEALSIEIVFKRPDHDKR